MKKIFYTINLLLIFTIIATFYLWISTYGTFKLYSNVTNPGFYISYNHLSDAFIAGKLYLLKEPDSKLLKLKDPYDPNLNKGIRWHDASLYNGKYYLYFGVVPAVLFYVPYKLLTGYYMPDNLLALLLMFGGFLWASAILIYIKDKYFPEVSNHLVLLCLLVLGFSNNSGFLLGNVRLYEIAIATGYFFSIAAIYFFCRAFDNLQISCGKLFCGGLCAGLALGSRPNYIFLILFIVLILFKLILSKLKLSKLLLYAFSLLFPYILCLLLLMFYNYFRFKNPFETGHSYQLLAYFNNKLIGKPSLENLNLNFYLYFLHRPKIDYIFPFVHLSGLVPSFLKIPKIYFAERMAGILPTIPFVFLLIMSPILLLFSKLISFLLKRTYLREFKKFPLYEFSLLLLAGISNLSLFLLIGFITYRYLTDFVTFFILSSSIIWFYFDSIFKQVRILKILLRIIAIAFAIISIYFGIAFGIDGKNMHYFRANRHGYFKLSSYFAPISKFLLENLSDWNGVKHQRIKLPVSLEALVESEVDHSVKNAIDNRVFLNWTIGGLLPREIIAKFKNTSLVASFWVFQQHKTVYRDWEKVSAFFYADNKLISRQVKNVELFKGNIIQHIEFEPVLADKVKLVFYKQREKEPDVKNIENEIKLVDYVEIFFEGNS